MQLLASLAHRLRTSWIRLESARGLVKRKQQLSKIWHCSFFFMTLEQKEMMLVTRVS